MVLVAALVASATIGSHGVSATLPPGWHGRAGHGFLEAATMPLAPERGTIGDATRRRLRRGDVLLRLFENTGAIGPGAVRSGPPRPFRAREVAGRSAVRNFHVGRRVFSLFLDTGPGGARRRLAQVNRLVVSLRIGRGDFYPGIVRPPRFERSRGWYAGSTRPVAADAVNQTGTWAATVPWSDPPFQLPPHRTLARLDPHGIAIQIAAFRDDRSPPSGARSWPPFHLRACSWGNFEGAPQYPLCTLGGSRAGQYDVEIRVFFAAAHPTRADRARAQAELGRLRLPAWPRF